MTNLEIKEFDGVRIGLKDGKTPVCSSFDVARLFEKEHYNVVKDIKELVGSFDSNFKQTDNQAVNPNEWFFKNVNIVPLNNGTKATREQVSYHMTEDGFTLLVMGYRGAKALHFKVKYISAFNKMKEYIKQQEEQSVNVPKNFKEALFLAYKQQEKIEEQQKLIEVQKPKAEYYDELVDNTHLTNLRDTAKELGVPPIRFNKWLEEHGYIYHDKKKNIRPTAQYVGKYFELKDVISSNSDYTTVQTRVTVEGKNHFRELINKLNNNDRD